MTQTLFMIGARGAGKTTVGSALALALGYQFVDTDLFMQQAVQMSVAEMVEREGWLGFRRRETIALQAVTKPSTVVATGGGAILAEENRQFMRQHGTVIYLRAPASVLAQRLEEYPEDAQRVPIQPPVGKIAVPLFSLEAPAGGAQLPAGAGVCLYAALATAFSPLLPLLRHAAAGVPRDANPSRRTALPICR